MSKKSLIPGLKQALDHDPKNEFLRLLLIEEYLKDHFWDQASQEVETLLSQNPLSIAALWALAQVKEAKKLFSESIVILEKVLSLDSHHRLAHLKLAELKRKEGLEEEARWHETQSKRGEEGTDPQHLLEKTTPLFPPALWENEIQSDEENPYRSFRTEQSFWDFSVVEGLESLKREIHLQFIWPFQEKKIYQEFGREAEGSLLLYGPPGCGKTFFCYATAGETLRPFYKIHLEEILDSYIGLTERNLSDLFEQARQESPSILFLEQIDALTQHSQSPGVLPQLLQQLEALSRQKILLLATSHQPWILPESAFSAHRFERLYFVPPPSLKQRSQLLTRFLQKKPVAIPSFNDLAKETEWYTCAELQTLTKRALDYAIEESLKNHNLCPLRQEHFIQAQEDIRPISAISWLKKAYPYAKKQPETYRALLAYLEIHQLPSKS